MMNKKMFWPKIIRIIALVLSFLMLVKTFICFLLSFAILEEPPEDWPQRLKDDCHPKWYSWFSLILNGFGVVLYSYMYFGILNTHKRNLCIGLVGVVSYLAISAIAHIAIWIEGELPHTMMYLNCIGTGISLICCPLSYVHYRRMIADEREQVMKENEAVESKDK